MLGETTGREINAGRGPNGGGMMLESVMAWILDTVREHGPLLLFLAAFLENAAFLSFVLPGEKLLLVGGYLVQQGELRFEIAWLCVFAGVVLGDHIG
jgi:membrane protein DedA with SNARE-associated domain